MKTKFFIFDLDGTLANIEHRLHFLKDTSNPDRWKQFYLASRFDQPIMPAIHLMKTLEMSHDIQIWTGRSEAVKPETAAWLKLHLGWGDQHVRWGLRMRPEGDHTPGHAMKEAWLQALPELSRPRLAGAFDDDPRVAEMFRRNGVMCCQVAAWSAE